MAGGVTNKDFIANAVDRNLGHCSNVANYRKWLEKEKTVKLELLKILPIALTWMKVCQKLSLDFITLLKQNIPFTETYVETVNIQVASSFVSFMDAATKYTHLRWYYYSAKNYRAYLYMMKAHRVNKARSFPKRQPRKGGMWHSRHAAFCRRWGSNRADNHRYTTNWGVWETRDSEHRCLDTGGWWSGGGSRHNLYYKSTMVVMDGNAAGGPITITTVDDRAGCWRKNRARRVLRKKNNHKLVKRSLMRWKGRRQRQSEPG